MASALEESPLDFASSHLGDSGWTPGVRAKTGNE